MQGHLHIAHKTACICHQQVCRQCLIRMLGKCTPSIMVSMMTAVTVCAVLAFMTVAPISRPRLCATRVTSTVANQLQKKAAGVKRKPPCMWQDTSVHWPNRGILSAVPKSYTKGRQGFGKLCLSCSHPSFFGLRAWHGFQQQNDLKYWVPGGYHEVDDEDEDGGRSLKGQVRC